MDESLYNALDESKPILAIFLDLQKAFNMVYHEVLLKKLNSMGLIRLISYILKSYLKNRNQRVRIGDNHSTDCVIEVGVP